MTLFPVSPSGETLFGVSPSGETHVINNPAPPPWLSVLIPVYNVQAYLDACVQSVLDQRIAGVEVLLLNDAATDESPALMQALAIAHPEIVRVFSHPRNRGLAAARNSLLGHARGSYVWFLDSDDLLFPGSIAALKKVVETHAPDLVLCDFAYVRERSNLVHRLRGERHRCTFGFPEKSLCHDRARLLSGLIGGGELHAWSKIARREVWQQAPFTVGRYFEDIPTIPALVGATNHFVHVRQPWVGYRQRAGSILSQYSALKLQHLLLSVTELNRAARLLDLPERAASIDSVEYFCLRTIASAARRFAVLPSAEQAELHASYSAALPELFPDGVAAVLQRWRRKGWWLRAIRIRGRLKKAGLL